MLDIATGQLHKNIFYRESGIQEIGAHVIAVRISDHATLLEQTPVSLVFKLLPVRLHIPDSKYLEDM